MLQPEILLQYTGFTEVQIKNTATAISEIIRNKKSNCKGKKLRTIVRKYGMERLGSVSDHLNPS
jgi:hypothetical protein